MHQLALAVSVAVVIMRCRLRCRGWVRQSVPSVRLSIRPSVRPSIHLPLWLVPTDYCDADHALVRSSMWSALPDGWPTGWDLNLGDHQSDAFWFQFRAIQQEPRRRRRAKRWMVNCNIAMYARLLTANTEMARCWIFSDESTTSIHCDS